MPRQLKTPPRKLAAAARYRAKMNADPVKKAAKKAYMRDYSKNYRANNKPKLTELSNERQRRLSVELRLQRKGLPLEHADQIKTHSGFCDICGGEGDGRWQQLNVDHCHETNVFRGLLCSNCNRGIGMFKDDPDLLRRAAGYLERFSQEEILQEAV